MKKFYELMNEVNVRNGILKHAHNYDELASVYPGTMTLKDIKESLMSSLLKVENKIKEYVSDSGNTVDEPDFSDEPFIRHIGFLEYLSDAVAKRWVNEFPQYFVCCNTVDEEVYNNCLQGPYTWYIRFRNGDLVQRKYKIADADKYKGVDVVQQRKMLFNEMMTAPDIRIWTMENYRLRA